MKRIKILKFAVLALLVLSANTSCNDWLDVRPKTEEAADGLYSTLDGFKEALAGVYINMTDKSLYGRDMTFGVVGILGQEWTSTLFSQMTAAAYSKLQLYNYADVAAAPTIDAIWNKMYNTIAYINTLLDYTEKKRSVLTGDYYEIIRGEALALRAFLHFDLLRLYGKHDFTEQNVTSIPYVTSTDPKVTPQSTNTNVITYIMADLNEAQKLLEKDPLYTGANVSDYDHGYLAKRQFNMNYYAVLALKARVHLYSGNLGAAKDAAEEVIRAQEQKGLFRWVTENEANADPFVMSDRTFSTEHVFSLNATNLYETIEGYFKAATGSTDSFRPFLDRVGGYESADFRASFFEVEGAVQNVPSKFWQYGIQKQGTPVRDVMPMIRISEMYYIAAEYYMENGNVPKAASLYNTVRAHRNLGESDITDYAAMKNALLDEYRKEFMGEGQLFFWHKRNGTPTIYGSTAKYIVPMPSVEIDRGNREEIE